MKTSEILSTSNLRVLRNGKIVSPKENTIIKKKSTRKTSNNDHLSILKKDSNGLDNEHVKNINKSHGIMVTTTNYDDSRGLCILFENIPKLVINEGPLRGQKNNCSNKNGYTNLEDYIQLNEVQIYNKLKAKTEIKPELLTMEKDNQTVESSNSSDKKNNRRSKKVDGLVNCQNSEVRMTRRKTIKLQIEERKQLDQLIFNRYPKNTFKMFAIQLDDISKEVKFLRTLGLICRFKSPLTIYKTKRKS